VAGDAGSFPGPDWMPKQAHMADLQAATAAENLAAELAGRPADKTFKVELMCIVDSLDGMPACWCGAPRMHSSRCI
jgi:sulfide:quinone oxidoreductase